MTMYMFWQAEPKTHWLPALATERDTITRTKKPALVSVLDVDTALNQTLRRKKQGVCDMQAPSIWTLTLLICQKP